MKQFILQQILTEGDSLSLRGDEFHYICRVRRGAPGDSLNLRDSAGSLFSAEIEAVGEESCDIRIVKELPSAHREYRIHLYLCLCKGKKQDLMIRQAVEAGAHTITLLDSRFSQIRLDGKGEHKYDRWKKIIREAMQQSGSDVPTSLRPLIGFRELPEIAGESELAFFCHQEKLGGEGLALLARPGILDIHLVIGSEGGLAPDEIDIMREKGFSSLYLGDNVLRAETASIFALGALMSHMEYSKDVSE